MLILHAGVIEDNFYVWGEKSTPGVKSGAHSTHVDAKAVDGIHPYAAKPDMLGPSLANGGVPMANDIRRYTEKKIWLPTINNYPCASSPLIADIPNNSDKAVAKLWVVPALLLTTYEAIDLLCRCVSAHTLAPGVVVGDDLAYWAAVMRFGGSLVVRQQYLPGIMLLSNKCRAAWEPVIAGQDAELFNALATSMPSVSRAMEVPAHQTAVSANAIITMFLGIVVDYLVRTAAVELAPAFNRKRGLRITERSTHALWLRALRSSDGTLEITDTERDTLVDQIREWHRAVTQASVAPYRLCFRLEEPNSPIDRKKLIVEDDAPWRVRYILQATDDPSLMLTANEVWRGKGKKLELFTRNNTPPREYLLTSMGQASALSIKIEESLKTEHPDGYTVDIQGAYEFITDIAPALEEVGFGVFLPGWWSKKGSKSRLRAKAKVKSPQLMQNGAGFSLDAVLEFDWEVALGESQLSLEDLRALAALKSPLVRVRGQWVELRSDEIQAAIAFLENPGGTASARDIIRMALGEGTAPGGLPIDGVSATGWMGELLDEMSRGDEMRELEPPKGFVGQLRPYQSRGYAWLAFLRKYGLGACLADDMGLGKTVQTLAMLQRDREEGETRPVLLVCPTSVVGNWLKESARFTPSLNVLVHHGVTRERGESFQQQAEEYSLILTSYALLHRDYDVFKKIKWAGVILDEAQNIKNPSTKQARSARGLKADYRLALTGTPVENHVGELWSIMEFLNPGFLGTASEFHEKFFVPLQAERDQEAATRLKRLTGPFVLRRIKTDKSIIQDLPEKLEMKVYCSLTKEQASLYKSVVDQATAELEEADGIKRSGVILSTLMKLKQICNHPVHFLGDNTSLPDRSGKLDRLTEMIEEIYGVDDCALIFTQFTEMGNHLKRHLQETFGYEVIFLHGGVNKNNRDKMVERFQEEGGPRIFILSLKAGGTGLNLTRANHVFHYDRWWNPAVENQATDRAFRIGQTRAVQVHKFLCAGTLEDKIDELIDKKRDIADSVVGVGESWLTKLSTDELRDLFALREDAVSD